MESTTLYHMRPLFAVGLLAAAASYAQDNANPRFDAASVKPLPGESRMSTIPNLTSGRIRWTTDLAYLIGYAYRLDFTRVSGLHADAIYAVEATFDPESTEDRVRLMMQSLLADRFHLRCRVVVTEVEGFGLSIGKAGPKIRESTADQSYVSAILPTAGVTEMRGAKASMSQLAERLQRILSVPVWDRTGLSGNYDFVFRFAPDLSAEAQTAVPALSTALREELGLELKKQKGPLVTLVVDSIEQASQN